MKPAPDQLPVHDTESEAGALACVLCEDGPAAAEYLTSSPLMISTTTGTESFSGRCAAGG